MLLNYKQYNVQTEVPNMAARKNLMFMFLVYTIRGSFQSCEWDKTLAGLSFVSSLMVLENLIKFISHAT